LWADVVDVFPELVSVENNCKYNDSTSLGWLNELKRGGQIPIDPELGSVISCCSIDGSVAEVE
jgi:hypothetical protein